ncbi:L,D-transpeptidase [Polycladidibacter hongkongensis]|uniref:L,D-transpeptidase n=1 Tax=Polycladidibacter hongkongensis TaxID=1647556 RepID=UPI00082A7874|nr:L,D-transpeptidase [Pseudovibrio hongkongensis]
MKSLSRRTFLLTGSAALLAGCSTTPRSALVYSSSTRPRDLRTDPYYIGLYVAQPSEQFPLPAIDLKQIANQRYLRQTVEFTGPEPAGTLVVDPFEKFLYLVNNDGTAMRYGVGVGRAGFGWAGDALVQYKRKWPKWTPPAEMIARQPELEKYRNGMAPGLDNPLGARALYLFSGGKDTLYRLHGTAEVWSIGRNVSSGCIRLLNQDVVDLYNRVPNHTRVIVRGAPTPTTPTASTQPPSASA